MNWITTYVVIAREGGGGAGKKVVMRRESRREKEGGRRKEVSGLASGMRARLPRRISGRIKEAEGDGEAIDASE